jgi:hypothetical protein
MAAFRPACNMAASRPASRAWAGACGGNRERPRASLFRCRPGRPTVSRTATMWCWGKRGDGRVFEHQRVAARSSCASRTARPRCRPPPWSARRLHRDVRAPCCRTRPQRRPFDPVGAMYQARPKRRVCRRVRRERRAPRKPPAVPVSMLATPSSASGINDHDVQADHREVGRCTENDLGIENHAAASLSRPSGSAGARWRPPPRGWHRVGEGAACGRRHKSGRGMVR